MRWFLVICLIVTVSVSDAAVLRQTDFENVPDWTAGRPAKGQAGKGYPNAWAGNPSVTYPPPKDNSNNYVYDLYRVGATLFDPPYVTNMLEIRNGYGRSGGRGMLYNVEVSGSTGLWTGGDAMHYWLGTEGYHDLYVRFYLRYPPEFLFSTDGNGKDAAYQKIMKITRYNGTWGDGGNPDLYAAPSSGGRVAPVWIPDWYQYISTTPSQTYYYNSERTAPDYVGNDPSADFYSVKPQYYPQGQQFKMPTDNQWHCYEFRAKMNSAPGLADGISEVWLDGVKVWSKTNIAWVQATGSVTQGWNDVTVLDNATISAYTLGEQVTYPLYLDDVVISTSYIGLAGETAPVDTTPPTVLGFTIPATYSSTTVPVNTFAASDDTAVTGYAITTSITPPSSGWSATPQATVMAVEGVNTFYAWARDAAGNVSSAATATVTVTLAASTTPSTPRLRGNLRGSLR